jgi:hypothetical protein
MGEYELSGLGGPPMQAAAGYGEYMLSGMDSQGGTFDGIRPSAGAINRALNAADRSSVPTQAYAGLGSDYVESQVENEYVPSFLVPGPQQFTQDSLQSLGVPSQFQPGIAEQNTWIPDSSSVIVNDQGGGGIFNDPASLGSFPTSARPMSRRAGRGSYVRDCLKC